MVLLAVRCVCTGKLGPGFQEKIYQNALEIELKKLNLDIDCELERPIFYDGQLVGARRVDVLVHGQLILELKAVACLKDEHVVQTKNYTVVFGLPTCASDQLWCKKFDVQITFQSQYRLRKHPDFSRHWIKTQTCEKLTNNSTIAQIQHQH